MKGIKLVPNKPLTELQKLKVDNKMLRQEVASLKKQLKLYGVAKSLPSHKKGMLEINKEIALFPKNSGIHIQSFGFGFNKGVRWCHKEITK